MIEAYTEASDLIGGILQALDESTLGRVRLEAFSKHDTSQVDTIPMTLDRMELVGALRIAAGALRDMAGWLRIEQLRRDRDA